MSASENALVGLTTYPDGQEGRPRLTRLGATYDAQLHSPMAMSSLRGQSWVVSVPSAGIVVTALMLVSVASAIPIVGIYNPAGSGKNLIVNKGIATLTTGTVCNFVWGAVAAPSMSVANGLATHVNNLTFAAGSAGGSVARSFAGATAMVGTALPVRYFPQPQIEGATAAGGLASPPPDFVDGELVVAPGNFLGIFGITVTTATVVRASMTWEEVAI